MAHIIQTNDSIDTHLFMKTNQVLRVIHSLVVVNNGKGATICFICSIHNIQSTKMNIGTNREAFLSPLLITALFCIKIGVKFCYDAKSSSVAFEELLKWRRNEN